MFFSMMAFLNLSWNDTGMNNYEAFTSLDIRVGTVSKVEVNDKARKPSYKMWIDFGELGIKTSSGQYVNRYSQDELLGRQVVCITNLGERKIAGFASQVLVLGVESSPDVVNLLAVDGVVENGSKIF